MKPAQDDLLIEIGVEELPPTSLRMLVGAFKENIKQGLEQVHLAFDKVEDKDFVTPRRFAVRVNGLSSTQAVQTILKKGPMVSIAFDSTGKPTQAALGFAASCQTTIDALQIQKTEKGDCLVFEQTLPGQSVHTLIPKIVQDALHTLPLPKRMRWGDQKESFVRPVHWIVSLFGEEVIPFECFGITADRITYGHRFHYPGGISLKNPSEYESQLRKHGVIVSFEERRELIKTELKKRAEEQGAQSKNFDEWPLYFLIDEVTGLVEWPEVLVGTFDPGFLELPEAVLDSSMRIHQKCFPLYAQIEIDIQEGSSLGDAVDAQRQKLLAKFLIVSNIGSNDFDLHFDPQTVIQGNERVMDARLHDAAFFYRVDKETRLEARQEDLKKVVFQNGLGSLWDKSIRIKELSKFILPQIPQYWFENQERPTEAHCEHAALLCKTDLLTQMVGEFPELQGIMGRYYALNDEEPLEIARAIGNHYYPRFANDSLPDTPLGRVLALSDRIDTLVGIFGLGKRPTGDKDPYALRRQLLAVLRIIGIEISEYYRSDLDVNQLFIKAKELYGNLLSTDPIEPLLDFYFERLRGWYQNEDVPARIFEAVLAKRPTRPLDFDCRVRAVVAFQDLPEAESLAAANKRVRNILTKSAVPIPPETSFDSNLLKENAEKQLAKAISEKKQEIAPLLKANQYTEALKSLASLKEPIDQFFDSVMVMIEDIPLRNNRLKLLNQLRALFLEIADISLL